MRDLRANRGKRGMLLTALLMIFVLVAAGCTGDDDESADDATGDETATDDGTATDDDTATGDGSDDEEAEAGGSVNIGWIPWDEDIAVTQLWNHILAEEGYDVELTQLDVAPVYSGMAQGDIDVFLDGWLPTTHEDYYAEFGDQLEDIGSWYDNGTLNLAVPSYVDATTIADLEGRADEFNGQIVGIEPGAGLMRITREEAIPTYGLEDYELVESSTPSMLSELERALDREEPIVVTLWHPHWAYAAYDIKDLEDPEGAMGDAEQLHVLARDGFGEDFPQLAEWLGNFEMPDDALASLEDLVLNEYEEGQESEAVEEWLEDESNQELVDSWLT